MVEMMDGRQLLVSGAPDLAADEFVARYKSLADVGRASRVLKVELEIGLFLSPTATADPRLRLEIAFYAELTITVSPSRHCPSSLVGPDDDCIMAGAVAARAVLLVYGDADLLSIGRYCDFDIVNSEFLGAIIASERRS